MKNIFSIILIFLALNSTFAQRKDTTKTTLEEVVIIDPLTLRKQNSAQQIEMLFERDIRFQNVATAADLVANLGTITVQKSQQGGGSPILRGFEASRILLMVDGVRMNNLIYRAGHLQNIITIDPSMLQRVDVLSGSASTEYGSDALGGVIHFQTKNPELSKIGGSAFVRYGTAAQEKTGHFDLNLGGRKLASLTSVTYSDFGDLRMGANHNPFYDKKAFGERPFYVERINGKDSLVANDNPLIQRQSAYKQYDILEKIMYATETTKHTLNLQYSNSSDIPRYDRLTDPKGTGLNQAQWYYGPQKRIMAAYDMVYNGNVHANVNYQNVEESRHSRAFGNKNLTHRIENVDVVGYMLDVRKYGNRTEWHYGVDGQYSTVASTATKEDVTTGTSVAQSTRYPDGDNAMNHVAVYLNGVSRFPGFKLNEGLRVGYSTLNSTFVDKTFFPFPFNEVNQKNLTYSGNLGLVYSKLRNSVLRAGVSSGFRVPNVDDMSKVFETSATKIIVPNPDLKPEKTLSFDLNLETKLGDGRAVWENRVYATRLFDALIVTPFLFEGKDTIVYNGKKAQVVATQNQNRAYILGGISELSARFGDNWQLKGALAYTYGRFTKDEVITPMDHIAPLNGRLALRYTTTKLESEFYTVFNGKKQLKDYYLNAEDNEAYATPEGMPAWITLNLKGSYMLNKMLTLQFGVENILDTQYRVFASGINGAGRNVFGTVRVKF